MAVYRFLLPIFLYFSFYLIKQSTCNSSVIFIDDDIIEINSTCTFKQSGKNGTCVKIADCPAALKNFPKVDPQICFFDRSDLIVCCEVDSDDIHSKMGETPTEKIAERVCKDRYHSEVGNIPRPIIIPSKTKRSAKYEYKEIKDVKWGPVPVEDLDSIFGTVVPNGVAADDNEFEHMVAIAWNSSDEKSLDFKCGGILVEENFVITSAHCLRTMPYLVRLGGVNISEKQILPSDQLISSVYIHPNYNPPKSYNDIAIIKLKPANKTDVPKYRPACLWLDQYVNETYLYAIGYGETTFAGFKSNFLMKLNLTIYKNEFCDYIFEPKRNLPCGIIESQVCAGHPEGKTDTCQGDSGGPLGIKYEHTLSDGTTTSIPYIVGITSFGQKCGGSLAGVYTRISYFIDWISSIVWEDYSF